MISKKKHFSWLILALLLLISGKADAFLITSTFDTDADGWTSTVPSEVSWDSTGGNVDGYMRHEDGIGASTLLIAPSKFLGDWSGVLSVAYDHKIFQTGNSINTFVPYFFQISGPGGSAQWIGSTPNGATDWTTQSTIFDEGLFNVTSGTWDDLVLNVTDFRIKTELVDNGATSTRDISGIDNVLLTRNDTQAVPEPATLSLLSLGITGLRILRRKRDGKENAYYNKIVI